MKKFVCVCGKRGVLIKNQSSFHTDLSLYLLLTCICQIWLGKNILILKWRIFIYTYNIGISI